MVLGLSYRAHCLTDFWIGSALALAIVGCGTANPAPDRFSCDTAAWTMTDFDVLKSAAATPLPEAMPSNNLVTAIYSAPLVSEDSSVRNPRAPFEFLVVRDAGFVRFAVNAALGTQAPADSGFQFGVYVDGIELSDGYVQEGRIVERPVVGADGIFRFYKDVDFSAVSRSPHLVSLILGLQGGSSQSSGRQFYSIGERPTWDALSAETPAPSQRVRIYQSQLYRSDGLLALGRQSGRPTGGQYSFVLTLEVDDRDSCPDATVNYIVFATLDGLQHPVGPGLVRRVFAASRRVVSETNLTLSVPEDGGYHELQIFCVPTYGQFPSTPDGKETPASRYGLVPVGTASWE
jgi:hypothetical protein